MSNIRIDSRLPDRSSVNNERTPNYTRRRIGAALLAVTVSIGAIELAKPVLSIASKVFDKAMGTDICPTDAPNTYYIAEGQDAWGVAQEVARGFDQEDPRTVYNTMRELNNSDLIFVTPGQDVLVPSDC